MNGRTKFCGFKKNIQANEGYNFADFLMRELQKCLKDWGGGLGVPRSGADRATVVR